MPDRTAPADLSDPEAVVSTEDWDEDDWADDCDPSDCDHQEAVVDILTGEMSCHCGYHRYLSGDELEREAELQARMMEAYYAECERDG
jgi:hypothetical protein